MSRQSPKQSSRLLNIGILAYPGAQLAAVYGLQDLFATVRHRTPESKVTLDPLVIDVSSSRPLPAPKQFLTALIVPPSLTQVPEEVYSTVPSWLVQRHREGTVVCSVCAGAFLLASSGLLEGRPATTHFRLRAEFEKRFPDIEVDTQKLLIDDGDLITAGGVMSWLNLGLELIRRFVGPTAMLAVARHWVVDPGGREQRFYECFAPVLNHGDEPVLLAQHWLHANCTDRISLAAVARKVGLSARTFLRRFRAATGHSPNDYLQLLRVERAREMLERTTKSFEEIAWSLSYQDTGAFRRVFVEVMGLAPGEYRRRFGVLRPSSNPRLSAESRHPKPSEKSLEIPQLATAPRTRRHVQ